MFDRLLRSQLTNVILQTQNNHYWTYVEHSDFRPITHVQLKFSKEA
jgi:hypothetical protein